MGESRYARVNKACKDDLANPHVGGTCDNALQDMLTSMGDFTTLRNNWNVYEIYDTCSDMPHRRLGTADTWNASTADGVINSDIRQGEAPPHTAGSGREFAGTCLLGLSQHSP